ncbi:reverse transcriptase [Caerostris darwini]|uniref:Reverse transcriptase n=1 Tax=Caerostris darwini TaxID=1538125 RepID=A0AAV4W536_9ARAC|nr:reverse transcriptase [Caerostris darwini]
MVKEKPFCNLSVEECDKAEKIILIKVQRECFEKNRNLSNQTYLDPDDLLRVKTRIIQRKDQESFRYPILLPSKHHIVDKLIFEKHVELCHAGIQVLMSTLREEYWIIKSRKTIRQVIRNCLRCKRFSIHPLQSISAPLPEDRIREAQVFEVIGVDLCGPLFLKDNKKCWIVLFTCAIFRAVHLELKLGKMKDLKQKRGAEKESTHEMGDDIHTIMNCQTLTGENPIEMSGIDFREGRVGG